jgi:hypothetical protein
MNKKQIISVIAVIILVAAGAFYGGMQYGSSRNKANPAMGKGTMNNGNGQRTGQASDAQGKQKMAGNQNGGNFLNGSITSKDDKSMTVKAPDGSSKIIFFSDTTTIEKSTSGAVSDLAVGQQIMVNGKTNTDGSITAQNIQINSGQANQ